MRIIGLNNLSVEKNFFCLLSRFRIEAHFPLASPVIFRKRIIALNFTLPLYIGFKTRVLNLFHCYFFKITCSYIVVWSDLSRKWISCDCFGRSKCFTFLESLLIGEPNKHGVQFFLDNEWCILQTRMEKFPKSQKYILNYKCYYNETLLSYSP